MVTRERNFGRMIAGSNSNGRELDDVNQYRNKKNRVERDRRDNNSRIIAELRKGRTTRTTGGTTTDAPGTSDAPATTSHRDIPAGVVILWRKITEPGGEGGNGDSIPT